MGVIGSRQSPHVANHESPVPASAMAGQGGNVVVHWPFMQAPVAHELEPSGHSLQIAGTAQSLAEVQLPPEAPPVPAGPHSVGQHDPGGVMGISFAAHGRMLGQLTTPVHVPVLPPLCTAPPLFALPPLFAVPPL